MSYNNSLIVSTPSMPRQLKNVSAGNGGSSLTTRSDADRQRLHRELRELDRDLEDGDLRQAKERLFYLLSSLLLDPSSLDQYGDGKEFAKAVNQLQEERASLQAPICRLLCRYYEDWIAALKRSLQAEWKKQRHQWTSSFSYCWHQQQKEIDTALYTTDTQMRVLAVRHLMRLVHDPQALNPLRRARDVLEGYREYVEQKRARSELRATRDREQQLNQQMNKLHQTNDDLHRRVYEVEERIAREENSRKQAEKRTRQYKHDVVVLESQQEQLRRENQEQHARLATLAREKQMLENKIAKLTFPAWQAQVDDEIAANRYYAEQVERIKQDRTLTKKIRDQLLEKVNMLWDQSHFEMMQPVDDEEGAEPCEPFGDDQEPSRDDPPLWHRDDRQHP